MSSFDEQPLHKKVRVKREKVAGANDMNLVTVQDTYDPSTTVSKQKGLTTTIHFNGNYLAESNIAFNKFSLDMTMKFVIDGNFLPLSLHDLFRAIEHNRMKNGLKYSFLNGIDNNSYNFYVATDKVVKNEKEIGLKSSGPPITLIEHVPNGGETNLIAVRKQQPTEMINVTKESNDINNFIDLCSDENYLIFLYQGTLLQDGSMRIRLETGTFTYILSYT